HARQRRGRSHAARRAPRPPGTHALACRWAAAPRPAAARRGHRLRAARRPRHGRGRSPGAARIGSASMSGPLQGVRVVEFTDESAEYCGRMLAGLGADVVKAEPAGGAPSRALEPFVDDEPGPERSLAFWADNVGKRSVLVGDDGHQLAALAAAADVFVHT